MVQLYTAYRVISNSALHPTNTYWMRGILLCAIHWAGGHSPGTQAALDTQTDALNDTSVRALLEATESQDLTGAFSREEALEEMDTT